MPLIPLANNFLAGSLLSLLMPTLVLIAITVWYVLVVRRLPGYWARRRSSHAAKAETPAGTTSPEADPPASSP